jgi:hypothetical protein
VLKWVDFTVAEMKKLFAIIILMGQVKEDTLKEYWSTSLLPVVARVFIYSAINCCRRYVRSYGTVA